MKDPNTIAQYLLQQFNAGYTAAVIGPIKSPTTIPELPIIATKTQLANGFVQVNFKPKLKTRAA